MVSIPDREVPLISDPWTSQILPNFSTPPSLNSNSGIASLNRLELTTAPSPENEISQRIGLLDRKEFEARVECCKVAFEKMGYNEVEKCPQSLHDKEDDLMGIGLRYLLPFHRHQYETVVRLLGEIQRRYFNVPYHHCGHAALVAHHSVLLAKICGLWRGLNELDKRCLVLSAIGHDIGHPGKSQIFLRKIHHPLSTLYCDRSVLETYHCASLLHLLSHPDLNLFADVPQGKILDDARRCIIVTVLNTDLGQHYEVLNEIQLSLQHASHLDEGTHMLGVGDVKRNLISLAVKAGDISYLASSSPQTMLRLTIDYYEEVLHQSEVELQLKLTPTEQLQPRDLGSPRWFERNAMFACEVAMPLMVTLANAEVKLRAAQTRAMSPSETAAEELQLSRSSFEEIGEREGLGTARSEVAWLLTLKRNDVASLADALAHSEGRDASEFIRPDDPGRLSKIVSTLWDRKSRRTGIHKYVIEPLERNIKALRRAKYAMVSTK